MYGIVMACGGIVMAWLILSRTQTAEDTSMLVQADGRPVNMEACAQFLFVFTDANRLCVWSLTSQGVQPYGGQGRVVELPPDLCLMSMRCNCDGSKV